ncbi:hypothetical protein K438DRAFT_1777531 [Mycena galopus ATCC 62051]|nr:hypothetical protein K438DRAFT_1777531 [Mycena galopus ATCC 62051]
MASTHEFLFKTNLKANPPYAHNVAFPPPEPNTSEAQNTVNFVDASILAMLRMFFSDKIAKPMRDISEFLDAINETMMQKKHSEDAPRFVVISGPGLSSENVRLAHGS